MRSNTFIFILLTASLFQFSFNIKKEGDWKLIKNKNDIQAYTREVEGSDVKQVKVKTNIKSSLSALIYVFNDVSNHKNWVYKCAQAKTIKKINETDYYYYNESDAPWPVSNRDNITHAKIVQDPKTKIITINSIGIPNFIKEIDGIVRIKKLTAKWELVPKSNGTVDLTFYLLIDLGGDIPAWLVNVAIADGPYGSIFNYRKEVQTEKMQKIKLSYIEEL